MEQLHLRIMDGDVFPFIGEVFYKRSPIDGIRRQYEIHEEVDRRRCVGFDLDKGQVVWTDIIYSMKEIEPSI